MVLSLYHQTLIRKLPPSTHGSFLKLRLNSIQLRHGWRRHLLSDTKGWAFLMILYATNASPWGLKRYYLLLILVAKWPPLDVHDLADKHVLSKIGKLQWVLQGDVLVRDIAKEVEWVREHGVRAADSGLARGPVYDPS